MIFTGIVDPAELGEKVTFQASICLHTSLGHPTGTEDDPKLLDCLLLDDLQRWKLWELAYLLEDCRCPSDPIDVWPVHNLTIARCSVEWVQNIERWHEQATQEVKCTGLCIYSSDHENGWSFPPECTARWIRSDNLDLECLLPNHTSRYRFLHQ